MSKLVITVEGLIGAGKTTLIAGLKEELTRRGLKVVIIPEPVDEWEKIDLLKDFYEDKQRWAYTFQTMAFVTRVQKAIEVVGKNPNADIYIMERTVLTDRYVFTEAAKQFFTEKENIIYEKWWNMWSTLMPVKPNKIIYLKPNINVCMERVHKRHRVGEVSSSNDDKSKKKGPGVTPEYQELLEQNHHKFIYERGLFPLDDIITIDSGHANLNFADDGPEKQQVITHIIKQLKLS